MEYHVRSTMLELYQRYMPEVTNIAKLKSFIDDMVVIEFNRIIS